MTADQQRQHASCRCARTNCTNPVGVLGEGLCDMCEAEGCSKRIDQEDNPK